MIYLDSGATSFRKPAAVYRAVETAMRRCANPGRGGYRAATEAARCLFACREAASDFFDCDPEQVVFTANCTHGLNIAIHTLVESGARVAVSGFEHNAVMRPLYAREAKITVAGRRLFDREDTLNKWEKALQSGVQAAIFTHMSNVFGYILPVEEMAALCRSYGVPFIVDAAQSAGTQPVKLRALGADFIAMPGHKGLLGPQGTGLLLCNRKPLPLLHGGTVRR
jgi:selenocysteine lyase/cysteine desulfurase